jgi:hypothetical protein
VQVQGMGGQDLSLFGMQIDLEQARSELRAAVAGGGASGGWMCVWGGGVRGGVCFGGG